MTWTLKFQWQTPGWVGLEWWGEDEQILFRHYHPKRHD